MQIITRKEAIAQGLKRYFTGKPCKNGHIAERYCSTKSCLTCDQAHSKAWHQAHREEVLARQKVCYEADREEIAARGKVYRQANKDKISARMKVWYAINCEKALARHKVYRETNKEKIAASCKAHYKTNFDKIAARQKAYLANSPQARAALNLRTRIRQALSAAKATKSARTLELLGASISEVRAHLEAQFELGMTWDNWSTYGWHVDHIKPCASFDLTDPEQQKACFHYSNLQPLWAKDNLSKNDRLDWVPAEA